MQHVSHEAIKQLMEVTNTPVVSLFMPTHQVSSPPHVQEDTTRYKNLMREALKKLEQDHADQESSGIRESLESLLKNPDFWMHQSHGLAVIAFDRTIHTFNLGMNVDEQVIVDDQAYVTPLMVQAEANQPFTVLALAVHEPKVFSGDMYGLTQSNVDLPASPEAAFNIDEMHTNHLQTRGARVRQPSNANAPGMFHGHGGSPKDVEVDERKKFFGLIDSLIQKQADTSIPLVVCGTADYAAEYIALSSHPHIIHAAVEGNWTKQSTPDIHAAAWSLVSSEIVQDREAKILERYSQSVGSNKFTEKISDLLQVSREGRVDTLIVGSLIQTADTIQDSLSAIPTMIFDKLDASIEKAARSVYENGGNVVGLLRTAMPSQRAAVAILRY